MRISENFENFRECSRILRIPENFENGLTKFTKFTKFTNFQKYCRAGAPGGREGVGEEVGGDKGSVVAKSLATSPLSPPTCSPTPSLPPPPPPSGREASPRGGCEPQGVLRPGGLRPRVRLGPPPRGQRAPWVPAPGPQQVGLWRARTGFDVARRSFLGRSPRFPCRRLLGHSVAPCKCTPAASSGRPRICVLGTAGNSIRSPKLNSYVTPFGGPN